MDKQLIIASLKKASRYIDELPFPDKMGLWLNAFKCFILYGATPTDWKFYEMYKYNHRENKEIITSKKSKKLDKLFNPREFAKDFDDKVCFNTVYSSFVKRDWIYAKNKSKNEICDFVNKYKSVVVKPIDLSSGKGIYLYEVTNDVDHFISEIQGKNYLLEERIELIHELRRLNPDSCQTLRITTMITKEGTVDILAAAIRVGGGKEIVDNFHAKGVAYPIDIKEGIICGLGKDLNNNYFLRHPSTNILMPGYQIPRWKDVTDFVIAAALQNPKARWIGWDVAITPSGCEMVEGNYLVNCNFLQTWDKKGKYGLIKSYL